MFLQVGHSLFVILSGALWPFPCLPQETHSLFEWSCGFIGHLVWCCCIGCMWHQHHGSGAGDMIRSFPRYLGFYEPEDFLESHGFLLPFR